MNSKELMIGDWYTNSDGDICKVVKNLGNVVWGQGDDVSDSTDDPNPIPLTAEIMKKNGFNRYYESNFYSLLNGFNVAIADEHYITSAFNVDITVYYVHELQHALRLCGLDELADDFKV